MDRTTKVLADLESRAKETSLQELEKRGRSRVKVIKPSEIAGMIKDAVENALAGSGYVPPDKVEELVQQSRAEFNEMVAARQTEKSRLEEVTAELDRIRGDLAARDAEITALKEELANADQAPAESGGMNAELMMRLMTEIAELKAQAGTAAQGGSAPAAGGGGEGGGDGGGQDVSEKLAQIVGALDSKIDKLGMKVGITQAVEGDQVKLDGIFADHGEADIESNLDTVKVKARKGAGIGANLERMKKLRQQGGGD